jgi:UDP-GlcNAc3NAcA epimerase
MVKIVTVIGARPQFIKAAVVSRTALSRAEGVTEIIVHTGQHFDQNMSDVFFDELDIPKPAYHLGIGGGTHGQNTGRMIEKIEEVLIRETPDWVLVYGDTDSTLAGAIAASKLHIPIAHVEAGLRSFNRKMPEEINRILTDHVSSLLFTPTSTAVVNLKNEGVDQQQIIQVGDVMFDAALYYGEKSNSKAYLLDNLKINSKDYILVTLHRAENVDDREKLQNILRAFHKVEKTIIWPIHPRTRKRLSEFGINVPSNVRLIEPLGYLEMVCIEKNALLIATDSGGVQKEAYFHKVPCVTLREQTEWVELVSAGANVLVGTDEKKIEIAMNDVGFMNVDNFNASLYGNGDAGAKILKTIARSGHYNGSWK